MTVSTGVVKCEDVKYALSLIERVASRRKDSEVATECGRLFRDVTKVESATAEDTWTARRLTWIRSQADDLIDRISAVVKTEIREVLYPLPEIKIATNEFASKFFPSKYFQWLPEDRDLSPEALMGLLEGDLTNLQVAHQWLHYDRNSQPR